MARYVHREGYSTADLVSKGHAMLPSWANDGAHFFAMADRYERKNATVARTYEIALPRELSPAGREALAADIRAAFFERYPSAWAIHNPIDGQGGEHPHMHLMLSERRPTDDVARGPKQYFANAARPGQDPALYGVRKDRSWHGPTRLRELRAGVAFLTNAALEREGHAVAVSHESLRAQGHERDAYVYTKVKDKARVEAQREILHRDYHPWENDLNRAAWHEQKQREGLRDLSRAAVLDHVRDRFWRQDQSPEREQERNASFARAIEREYALTGRERQVARETPRRTMAPVVEIDKTQRLTKPLLGNRVSKIYHTPEHKNYGDVAPKNQVLFWTIQAAEKAGYRCAANEHYGRGTGQIMTDDGRRTRARGLGEARGQRRRGLLPGQRDQTRGRGIEDTPHDGAHVRLEEPEWEYAR